VNSPRKQSHYSMSVDFVHAVVLENYIWIETCANVCVFLCLVWPSWSNAESLFKICSAIQILKK
jgi:hypothetical protein